MDDNPSVDLEAFNKKFQEWLDWYNYNHEHSSLDGQAPAKVYLEHPRRIQRDLHASIDWDKWIGIFETRKVTKQGMISVGGVTYTLKDGFAGREVEIQQLPGKVTGCDRAIISLDAIISVDLHWEEGLAVIP